jgi:oligopeptide/dipeptide ABC transporter ATP-binding protein
VGRLNQSGAHDNALLSLRGLTVEYTARQAGWRSSPAVKAVDGVDLRIQAGESVGLVGESGCGKSSVAKAIVGLVTPRSGAILYDGADLTRASGRVLKSYRRRIQIIFQDPYSSLNPRRRIGPTLEEPLRIHGLASGHRAERVAELLTLVGLEPAMQARFPHEFSGGQRQRIGIARALAVEPSLLICDEPTSALDVSVQAQILKLLADLRSRLGLTFLFISHNLPVVAMFTDRIAVMYRGELVEVGPSADYWRHSVHPYTRALLSAVPQPDPRTERQRARIILNSDVSVESVETGCRFQPRCWLYQKLGSPERCRHSAPELKTIEPDRQVRCHFPAEARQAATEGSKPH